MKQKNSGATLIEVAVVVSIAGILMAVFIPVFFRELTTSKTSEAGLELRSLHSNIAAYYQSRLRDPTNESGARLIRCLPPSAGPAPASASPGPVAVNFHDPTTPDHEIWSDLGYEPASRIRYRYSVRSQGGCSLIGETARIVIRAEGDLDGDGKHSVFERVAVPSEEGELEPRGALFILDQSE